MVTFQHSHIKSVSDADISAFDSRISAVDAMIRAKNGKGNDFLGWIDLPVTGEDGYPEQERGVTSVPGLYFVGSLSAPMFGPMMRFVAGTDFAAGRVARDLVRRATAR